MSLQSIYDTRYTFQQRTITLTDWVDHPDGMMHKTWKCLKCGAASEKTATKAMLKVAHIRQSLDSEALFELTQQGCTHISTNEPEKPS